MDVNLEIARTKLTVRHLAQHSDLPDAESLLRGLRETVTFLERRIAREKLDLAKVKTVLASRNGDGPQVAMHKGRFWYADGTSEPMPPLDDELTT